MVHNDDVHVRGMGKYHQRAELWLVVMGAVLIGVMIAGIRVSNGWSGILDLWIWGILVVGAILFLPFWAWHMDPHHGDEDPPEPED